MPRIAIVYGGHRVVVGQYVGPQHVGLGQHVSLVQVDGYGRQVVLPRHGGHVQAIHHAPKPIVRVPKPIVRVPKPIVRVPKPIVRVTQLTPQGDHCDISYKGPGKVAGQPGLRMIEVWGSVIKDCGPYPG